MIPRLLAFLNDLTNWYVRLNRGRLKGVDGDSDDALSALCVLHDVLLTMTTLMAPLTPYFAEWCYQRLRPLQPAYGDDEAAEDAVGKAASVHFLMLPDYDASRLDADCEAAFSALQARRVGSGPVRSWCAALFLIPLAPECSVCDRGVVISAHAAAAGRSRQRMPRQPPRHRPRALRGSDPLP